MKKPDVFILDKAPSNLDAKTEREVMAAIREAAEGKTCIFIAHRLAIISECSQVIVMEDGEIGECATREISSGAAELLLGFGRNPTWNLRL